MIHEVERRLRVTEPVIKFISVRVDEEHKRREKIKAIRAQRVKRSPVPAAAGAEPAAETGSEPAAATV
jgi:small subunit ribosomal protein S6